jgi:septal ring factor EnvC (AmiA/AmiB activator)
MIIRIYLILGCVCAAIAASAADADRTLALQGIPKLVDEHSFTANARSIGGDDAAERAALRALHDDLTTVNGLLKDLKRRDIELKETKKALEKSTAALEAHVENIAKLEAVLAKFEAENELLRKKVKRLETAKKKDQ